MSTHEPLDVSRRRHVIFTSASRLRALMTVLVVAAIVQLAAPTRALAASAAELRSDSARALKDLYRSNSTAKMLGQKATAILVFPSIVKAGFLIAGQLGEGVLWKNGKAVGYYNSIAGSYGFQAGAQVFGYALFFMNADAVAYLNKSDGWEIGSGPSIVILDKGKAKSITSTTLSHDVYAFIFNQKGLMGGIGLQGSKITKINK